MIRNLEKEIFDLMKLRNYRDRIDLESFGPGELFVYLPEYLDKSCDMHILEIDGELQVTSLFWNGPMSVFQIAGCIRSSLWMTDFHNGVKHEASTH